MGEVIRKYFLRIFNLDNTKKAKAGKKIIFINAAINQIKKTINIIYMHFRK